MNDLHLSSRFSFGLLVCYALIFSARGDETTRRQGLCAETFELLAEDQVDRLIYQADAIRIIEKKIPSIQEFIERASEGTSDPKIAHLFALSLVLAEEIQNGLLELSRQFSDSTQSFLYSAHSFIPHMQFQFSHLIEKDGFHPDRLLSSLRTQDLHYIVHNLRSVFRGEFGELQASVFFGKQVIGRNVLVGAEDFSQRSLPHLQTPSGLLYQEMLRRKLDRIFKFWQSRIGLNGETLRGMDPHSYRKRATNIHKFRSFARPYPHLLRLEQGGENWSRALGSLNSFEIDLVVSDAVDPEMVSWVEVKALRDPIRIWDLHSGSHKVMRSLHRLGELRKFFDLRKKVRLEFFFPHGIDPEARKFLEQHEYGFLVHDGSPLFWPPPEPRLAKSTGQ